MVTTVALVRGYEVVIGLETHAQLSTRSKAFSGADTAFGAPANTQACAVDLALPKLRPGKSLQFALLPEGQDPDDLVRSGGPAGATFSLDHETVTIGREPSADVFLDDVTVSRNHAEITTGPAGVSLRDLGSLNGTYVNRRRIDRDEVLEDGDELQIGKFRLVV